MSHTQLTQDERYPIQYLSLHCTVTKIAKQLNRHKSTISREIKQHCNQGQQYGAEKAQRQTNLGFRRPFAIDMPQDSNILHDLSVLAKCCALSSQVLSVVSHDTVTKLSLIFNTLGF